MRFTVAAAAFAGAALVSAQNSTVYVTDVVSSYTTYCPEATMITHKGSTITVSVPTTLTFTDCPCTITKSSSVISVTPVTSTPVTTLSTVSTSSSAVVSPVKTSSSSIVVPTSGKPSSSTIVAPVYGNGTSTIVVPVGTATSAPSKATTSPLPTYTGAASKLASLSGAGLAAILGFAAYAL